MKKKIIFRGFKIFIYVVTKKIYRVNLNKRGIENETNF